MARVGPCGPQHCCRIPRLYGVGEPLQEILPAVRFSCGLMKALPKLFGEVQCSLAQYTPMSQVRKAQSDGWIPGGVYLLRFLCSAFMATAPATLAALDSCEGAYVSGHIASHTSTFPYVQGMIEHPSGCLPSDLHSPVGSKLEGILT